MEKTKRVATSPLQRGVMPPCSGADIVKKVCKHGLRKLGDNGWVTCFGYDGHVANKLALTPPCVEGHND